MGFRLEVSGLRLRIFARLTHDSLYTDPSHRRTRHEAATAATAMLLERRALREGEAS